MGSTQGMGFEGRILIGGNFGKLSKSGVKIESTRYAAANPQYFRYGGKYFLTRETPGRVQNCPVSWQNIAHHTIFRFRV
jgi:hypothetical protein